MATTNGATAGELFQLVHQGRADSRAELARLTGLSASTVATRIDELIDLGFLEEAGHGHSTGGRRPRRLAVKVDHAVIAAADLGDRETTIGLLTRSGQLLAETVATVSLHDEPVAVLQAVWEAMRSLAEGIRPLPVIEGVALSLPGPVDARDGRLLSPMRMPGWNGLAVGDMLAGITGLPVHVDNDANAMAVGEYVARGTEIDELVLVKAGTGIGCGIVVRGELYRGYRGVAGDISHVTLTDAPPIACSCGRVGCLDVVASGSAIVDALRDTGVAVDRLGDVLGLERDAHPHATALLREAGQRTGEVLATIINFANPRLLAIGGQLATSDAFVAGIRQAVYTLCPPMSTDLLQIDVSAAGSLAGVRGVGHALLARLIEPARIDALVAA